MIDQQMMLAAIAIGLTTAILATPLFWATFRFLLKEKLTARQLLFFFIMMATFMPILHYIYSSFFGLATST